MHNVALTWQQAAVLTAALALATLVAVLAGRSGRRGVLAAVPFVREAAIISGLYSVWQLAGSLSVLGTTGAFQRARGILRLEHDARLPSEASVQSGIVGHPLLVQVANLYYDTMHFGALFVFLIWMFIRHREDYRRTRLTLALLTLTCLLIQLVPVAPPRLLPGFTDTARQYGQSVYSLGLAPDQLSAMPSVHVGWAVLIAWAALRIGRGRWRCIGVPHAAATIYVVVATGNHFWLDGAVAIVLLVAVEATQTAARRALAARRSASAGGRAAGNGSAQISARPPVSGGAAR